LSFQTTTNLNGSNLVNVVMRDNGGTTNGGLNSTTNTFSLIVSPGNDAPLLGGATNRTLLEDATTGLTAAITATDIDTDSSNFVVTASSLNTNLVTVTIDGTNAAWTLTFVLKTNANGTAPIVLVADDGVLKTTNTFVLTVTPVNDVPEFTVSTNRVVISEDANRTTLTNFLTGLAAGPSNESSQTWTFTVTSTTNVTYVSAPAITTNGILSFQTTTNLNGSNQVTVVMRDN